MICFRYAKTKQYVNEIITNICKNFFIKKLLIKIMNLLKMKKVTIDHKYH